MTNCVRIRELNWSLQPALVSSGNDTPEEDGEEKEEKEKQIQSKTVEQKEDMEELAEIEVR